MTTSRTRKPKPTPDPTPAQSPAQTPAQTPAPFTFEVDGETFEMPPFNEELYEHGQMTLAEAARNRAKLGRAEFEFDNLLTRFGDMQLAIERHLTEDAHAPAAHAIARLIEDGATKGYAPFFEFFNAWMHHDGSEVVDESGESSGSQES